jgi:hypothetical protein
LALSGESPSPRANKSTYIFLCSSPSLRCAIYSKHLSRYLPVFWISGSSRLRLYQSAAGDFARDLPLAPASFCAAMEPRKEFYSLIIRRYQKLSNSGIAE